jgi:hypothetical protein
MALNFKYSISKDFPFQYNHTDIPPTTAPLKGTYRKGNELHVDIDIKEEHYAISITSPCALPDDDEYVGTIPLNPCPNPPPGVTNYTYVHQLPIWAVQYIVVRNFLFNLPSKYFPLYPQVENYNLSGKIEIIPGTAQEELEDE